VWSSSNEHNAKGNISTNVEDSENIDIDYLCFSGDLLKHAAALGDDMHLHIRAMNMSSGQGALEQLIDKVEKSIDKPLLILDEPEKGLSSKRVNLIFKYLLMHAYKHPKQQMIIVTHSKILMELGISVYSASHRKNISAKEYIEWMEEHKSMSSFADGVEVPLVS
jgi:predicted ATPase